MADLNTDEQTPTAKSTTTAKVETTKVPYGGSTTANTNLDTPYQALLSRDGWEENQLSSSELVNYHFKLFMVDDSPLQLEKHANYNEFIREFDQKRSITLAESGVTGLNITNVEMTSIAVPHPASRSTSMSKLSVTIQESTGVNFMDNIASAAGFLGIDNYAKTRYFLELRFLGYDANGKFDFNPCDNSENKGRWLYQLSMVDMDVKVDGGGAVYTMQFVPFEEVLMGDDFRLPDTITPEGSTVGEIFDSIEKAWNQSIVNMWGYELKKFKFKFVNFVDPKDQNRTIRDFKVSPLSPDLNDQRSAPMDAKENDVQKPHFVRGSSIKDLITLVFANSEEAQQLAKDVSGTNKLEDDSGRMKVSTMYQMSVHCDIVDYDVVVGDYVIHYTITISPYFTTRPVLSKDQIEAAKDPKVQAEAVTRLRKSGYLVKRYDYIFSGTNTEIQDLDIHMNMKWSAVLPRVMGFSNSLSSQTTHAMKNPVDAIKEHQDELQKLNAEIASTGAKRKDADKESSDLLKQESLNDAQRQRLNELAATSEQYQLDEESLVRQRQTKILGITAFKEILAKDASAAKTSRLAHFKKPENQGIRYAEDLVSVERLKESTIRPPISISQSVSDSRYLVSGAFPDSYHRDRSIFGAVMDQLYETNGMAMQTIALQIKGDPYWLGNGGLMRNFLVLKAADGQRSYTAPNSSIKDLNQGDVLFLLYFKYPHGVDSYGAPILRDNEMYSGVYIAKEITSKFSGGMFTQTIDSFRLPLLDVFKAAGYRDPHEWQKIEEDKKAQADSIRSSGGQR